MKRSTRWWWIFAVCNVVVAGALLWTSAVVIGLERSESRARAETGYQEALRLAMWRMDSWLSLLLAREATSPRDGESEYVLLRFEVDSRNSVTSSEFSLTPIERFEGHLRLDAIRAALERADLLVDTEGSETRSLESRNELDARVACTVPPPPGSAATGRQVVAWLDSPVAKDDPALVFLRRAGTSDAETFEGFVLDWPRLHDRLLFEIRDLFPVAELQRADSDSALSDPVGHGLTNMPVNLVTPAPIPTPGARFTAGRVALLLAWLAAIVAAVAVGATLRKSIDLGERRRRFVSAVTHELRTPLTTFQLYSELLADGRVPTAEQRREYVETLRDEAQRLSAMVANVLSHARLEQGSAPRRLESMSLESLISRVRPPLERRAETAGMTLEVGSGPFSPDWVAVDAEAIGQILTNLVDNAAKYAGGEQPATIHLDVATLNGSLLLTVRDHGPGVPREQAKAIFAPFERGGRDAADGIPGVGLGLALAVGLAREMGGDLTLENPSGRGASFRLELPTKPA